ncbi:hypothetical protein QBC47DRAFT_372667 [Echria macrotheca]|uniref:Transcriptional regulatory protein RXT2 N-terminal domain-containing protein n=1 Tax=Echria macrotheca TaxID=438768 RepID=A0AAJ0FG12_9PEZI|nr:hypothetical protein QBC47DRAFT_372667 [Echria macrotheca]
MSTQQQALIVETVHGLRKSLRRKAYESDSDSSIEKKTNRGYKLKKRARFVKQGRLAPSTGPAAYKEVAELAGFQRAIINHNPPLVDEDGYELDSDDDEDHVQEAVAAAMEENPYSSIQLEHLLAPLTSVTDLPTHPTLSRPFTSKALTELVNQGCKLMHKENAALWKAKPLLTRLVGDNTWVPCGLMIEDADQELFTDPGRFLKRPPNSSAVRDDRTGNTTADVDGEQETTPEKGKGKELVDGEEAHDPVNGEAGGTSAEKDGAQTNGESAPRRNEAENETSRGNHDKADGRVRDVEMTEAPGATHGAQPNAPSMEISARAETPEDLFIHPFFLPPRSAHPDRDLGLPEQEAEDVRRLLQLYVQKQDEVCRGTKKLYQGLLKADRYRRTVLQWAKAEAHCGPNRDMSDGEDWYDKEEWGLTEDLKKGEDEVEEDTTQTQKKTRNRK